MRLSAFQQEVLRLRSQGLTYPQIGRALGRSVNYCKVEACCARKRLREVPRPKSRDWPPGIFCVFRFGPYVGVLPRHLLSDWVDRCGALFPGATLEILLGRSICLNQAQARIARRALGGMRPCGFYKIDTDGKKTFYSGEKQLAREMNVRLGDVHSWRAAGVDQNGSYYV